METNKEIIRKVLKTEEFNNFFNSLDKRVQAKYDYSILILETQKIVSTKFVKKIQETEFFEVRVSTGTNEYRTMLIATDNINFMEATQVVLLNSFLKKDEKQYRQEIKKARTILIEEEIV